MSEPGLLDVSLHPDISHLVTEDDTPVDNLFSAKQQRLLVDALYSSWLIDVPFLACANVGIYYAIKQSPLVPDVFLSLDVTVAENWWEKKNRSYLFWEFGKAPEVVIEIVSNTVGNELGSKLRDYARIGISYYVVFDPIKQLSDRLLQIYRLNQTRYTEIAEPWMDAVGLGMCLWEGVFEGKQDVWLRWCDREGTVIPTGAERAESERQRAEQAESQLQQAESQLQQAESQLQQERQRAERLMELLRERGINPEEINS